MFEAVSNYIDPFIGKFNLRENNVRLTLDGFQDTAAAKVFCNAAYKAVLFLCLVWPYGGKQKLSVARKMTEPLFVDKLLLSVFHCCPEFSDFFSENLFMTDFILNAFSKVKKVVYSRNETTQKSPHFLKTMWERDLVTYLHLTCFSTVRVHVYLYKFIIYVFFLKKMCFNTYICVFVPICVFSVECILS